jgi:hypothetical protein
VAFTPWTSPAVYGDLLLAVRRLGLVGNVAPVQYAIRLLIPQGSRLLELADTQAVIEEFDPEALCYRWHHPEPQVDELQQSVNELVQAMVSNAASRAEVFASVARLAARYVDGERAASLQAAAENITAEEIPTASEPWYCCAEPLEATGLPHDQTRLV